MLWVIHTIPSHLPCHSHTAVIVLHAKNTTFIRIPDRSGTYVQNTRSLQHTICQSLTFAIANLHVTFTKQALLHAPTIMPQTMVVGEMPGIAVNFWSWRHQSTSMPITFPYALSLVTMGAACILTILAWCMGLFDAHGSEGARSQTMPGEQKLLVSPMMVALTKSFVWRLCTS